MSASQSLRWGEHCLRSSPVRGHKGEETEGVKAGGSVCACVCVCVCVRERTSGREREEVTSPVPVLGSNLRLEPVVAIQIHEG